MPEQMNELEEIFEGIEQNEGDRLALVCRGVVSKRLALSQPFDDWTEILDEARHVLNPNAAAESEAQASLAFRSRISIRETKDDNEQ